MDGRVLLLECEGYVSCKRGMIFKKNGAHNGTGKHYYLHYILHHFRLYIESKIHHQHGI